MKYAFTLAAIALILTAYLPYIRDTRRGKTKPHVFTWGIISTITLTAFALQLSAGAGVGAFVTLTTGLVSFGIFLLSLSHGDKHIVTVDKICTVMAVVALVVWIFAKQPIVSILLISASSLLGYVPTVRKSWKKPGEETLSTYLVNTLRYILALAALEKYSPETALYPAIWVGVNAFFSLYLIIRRRQLS